MDRDKFRLIVEESIQEIPAEFLEKLDNVSVVVEDKPTPYQRGKLRLRAGWTLFGLYEGVPKLKRNSYYSGVLPDKITIFQMPIEEHAKKEEDIKRLVYDTIIHEIAHHFGMNEAEVRAAEHRRAKK